MSGISEEFDLGAKEGAVAPSDALSLLKDCLAEMLDMERVVEQMEEDLKAAKHHLQVIKTSRVPDLMNQVGVSSLTMEGKVVELTDFVSGSLPKDPEKRQRAMEWLENEGAAGLLKTEVSIEFGRNQHNEALSVADDLRNKGYSPLVSSNIAPQTLAKFARDRLKAGESIDFELLGLYTGKVAKVKESKK